MEKIMNWEDIEETKRVDIEGRYTFKVMSYDTKTTTNGNECHVYSCKTKDGELMTVSLYLVEKALWKYKAFASACGVSTTGRVDFDQLPKELIGKMFVGEVKRQPDVVDVVTGNTTPSKCFEVTKFFKVEE